VPQPQSQTPQPSALALASVGGCALGAALLLLTPWLRIASARTPLGEIVVRPGLSGGGWGVLLCGLAAAGCVALALLRREARWLGGAALPGLIALGWAVWYFTVRLPALAYFTGHADTGPGAWTWYGGSALLIAAAVAGALVARDVARRAGR
jgi:hypothetical protein